MCSAVKDASGRVIDFRIEYLNPAAARANAISREQQIGHTLCELFAAHRKNGLIDAYARVIQTGIPFRAESFAFTDYFSGELQTRYFDIQVSKFDDSIVATWRDVTDADATRREAESLREHLSTALRSARMCSWDWDIATDREQFFGDCSAIFGREAPASYEEFREVIHPDDVERLDANLRACMRERSPFYEEFRVIHADGTVHWIAGHGRFLHDEAGRAVRMVGVNVDITSAKERQDKLRDSEERLRILSETIPQLVWMADASGYTRYYNQRWYDYTGQSPDEAAGFGWQKALHPDDHEHTAKSWQAAVQAQAAYDSEYRLRRADGEYRWFVARGRPIHDDSGNTFWFGTSTDISEQKRAEEELRFSQERLQMALAVGNSGAYEWNIKLNVNNWTPELELLYGFEPGGFQCTYEAWRDCLLPEDVAPAEAHVLASFTSGRFDTEWRIRRKNDGQVRWLSAHGKVFFDADGKPDRMLGLNVDITERKQAEERVRLSESRYRSLIEVSTQLVWSCPGSGFLDHEIPEWQMFTGQSTPQILGWGWSEAVHPDDRAETLRVWQQAVRTKSFYTVEHRLRRKDGVYRHMMVRGVPVLDAAGAVIEYVGMHTDITEQKLAEDALIKTEKLAAAGRLAATVAHEINNPLEAATNLLYLLGTEQNLSETGRDYIKAAERELSRVAHVVRQTLGFYREQSSKEEVILQELIEEVLQLHQGRIVSKRIEVKQEIPENLLLRTVPGELRQILSNLVSNSLDALPFEGVLRIRARRLASVGNKGSRIQISVADSGCGFSPDTALHLFEPFFTTKKNIGTGLGLWVSRQLIHKHMGTIRARSREGAGTVFRIELPGEAEGAAATAA